jgi:hypothetical protein
LRATRADLRLGLGLCDQESRAHRVETVREIIDMAFKEGDHAA